MPPCSPFVKTAKLQLNGHDRFRQRSGSYFRVVQPYQHHTGGFDHSGDGENIRCCNCSYTNHNGQEDGAAANPGGIENEKGFFYVYSFAIKPEDHQPS